MTTSTVSLWHRIASALILLSTVHCYRHKDAHDTYNEQALQSMMGGNDDDAYENEFDAAYANAPHHENRPDTKPQLIHWVGPIPFIDDSQHAPKKSKNPNHPMQSQFVKGAPIPFVDNSQIGAHMPGNKKIDKVTQWLSSWVDTHHKEDAPDPLITKIDFKEINATYKMSFDEAEKALPLEPDPDHQPLPDDDYNDKIPAPDKQQQKQEHGIHPFRWIRTGIHGLHQKWFNWEMGVAESVLGSYIIGSQQLLQQKYEQRMEEKYKCVYHHEHRRRKPVLKRVMKGVGAAINMAGKLCDSKKPWSLKKFHIWSTLKKMTDKAMLYFNKKFGALLLEFFNTAKHDMADTYNLESKEFTMDEAMRIAHEHEEEQSLLSAPDGGGEHRWHLGERLREMSWKFAFKSLDIALDAMARISKRHFINAVSKPLAAFLWPAIIPWKNWFMENVVALLLDYLVDYGLSLVKATYNHIKESIAKGKGIEYNHDTMDLRANMEYENILYRKNMKRLSAYRRQKEGNKDALVVYSDINS